MIATDDPAEVLRSGVAAVGLGPGVAGTLWEYVGLLERWGSGMNLVRASGRELVVRHVLDCLAGWRAFDELRPGASVADVGSGAGLPGLALAAALPHLRVLLIERSSRRAAFLRRSVAGLGMGNAEVIEGQAVAAIRSLEHPPEAVTFRAVYSLGRDLREIERLLGMAPLVVAFKGRLERILEETALVRRTLPSVEVRELRVPFLEERRHLVILRAGILRRGAVASSQDGRRASGDPSSPADR